jgi:predicted NBD/HSP70 family sugar kinase
VASTRGNHGNHGGQTHSGADQAVMRELNRSLVLDVLKRESPISRAAIAKETKLAKPTVSAIVDELLAGGLVREIGPGSTTTEGGRPPILLEFNSRSEFYVGVHIGVRRTHVVVTDARGEPLVQQDLPTPRRAAPVALTDIAGVVAQSLSSAKAPRRRLAGVGVCVPGLVDPDKGVCLLAPNLGWRDVPVADVLGAAMGGVAVHVHNTAQACAVAETLEGAAKGSKDAVLLYAGTGVGAGIIVDERLYPGAFGIAGEVGHFRVEGVETRCSCGKVGCLETVVSVPAVEKAAGRPLEEVVAAAASGDAAAVAVLDDAGRRLGMAASWLVNLLNPEVVVVGGALAEAADLLLDPLRAAVAENALPQAVERLSVRPWLLGQDAKVRGAVLVAMQKSETFVRLIFGADRRV